MNQPWKAWLTMAHAALGIVLACYLVMVDVNSVLFDYNFWNDPPPSNAADVFAVVSLWVLFLMTSFIGAVTYSWMCEFASDTADGLRAPLRRAVRAAVRRWWIAVPGFALTVLACALFLPGITAVALLGRLPVRPAESDLREQLAAGIGELGSSVRIGAVVAFVVASTVWAAVLVGGYLVSRFDGLVETIAALLAYVSYLCSALVAGWAASEFASPALAPGGSPVSP